MTASGPGRVWGASVARPATSKAVRQINASIRDYPDVEVQVEPRDVGEIAQAIRSLR